VAPRAKLSPVDSGLPASTLLVLRDRAGGDAQDVLATAFDDLVASGAWRIERRGLRRRRVLVPAEKTGLPEPLRYLDGLLHRAPAGCGVKSAGAWVAREAPTALTVAVQRTVEELVAAGLLEQVTLRPTPAGERALEHVPPRERPRRRAFAAGWNSGAAAIIAAHGHHPGHHAHHAQHAPHAPHVHHGHHGGHGGGGGGP